MIRKLFKCFDKNKKSLLLVYDFIGCVGFYLIFHIRIYVFFGYISFNI